MPSSHGGRAHRHLCFVIDNAKFHAVTGEDFDAPENPGVQEPHAAGTSQMAIMTANRLYDMNKKEFTTYIQLQIEL